ncbi:hypothetical protein [uncultured Pseudosulfitobacter sp.]|uniref:hypothetical protein n=1 Tax=uncultured Pseudosulfitobacter sp. TaxID=2854214 RepID=UPI0030DB6087|tara:strand:- start:134 stop:1285 length:1152 start_codon:yes stop_codon:yes gene_type:complete
MADTLPLHTDVPATAHALAARALRPDGAELCARVNAAIKDTGMVLEQVADLSGGQALFSHPHVHLSVTAHRRKMPRQAMAGALASPFAKARIPDYDRLFSAHTGYVTLDVGHGAGPDDTIKDKLPLVLRLRVLKAALDALIATAPVSLVHWVQSDTICAPSELEMWKDSDLPFSLVMHPLPLPARPDIDGAARLAMIAGCSEHLLGKTLYLDPMPRDQATGLRQLVSILNEHHEGRIHLNHGDSLELTDGTVLHVRHENAASADRPGRICVGLTPPQARTAPTTDAAGFEDRLSRLKGVARGDTKMAVSITDKVEAEARPRKSLLSRMAFSLMVRGVVLPALLLVLYYTFVTPPKTVSVASNTSLSESLVTTQTLPAQGTAQP